jgi:hypothetical protein
MRFQAGKPHVIGQHFAVIGCMPSLACNVFKYSLASLPVHTETTHRFRRPSAPVNRMRVGVRKRRRDASSDGTTSCGGQLDCGRCIRSSVGCRPISATDDFRMSPATVCGSGGAQGLIAYRVDNGSPAAWSRPR